MTSMACSKTSGSQSMPLLASLCGHSPNPGVLSLVEAVQVGASVALPLIARVSAEGRTLRLRARRALEVRAKRVAEPVAALSARRHARRLAKPPDLAGCALDADVPVLDGQVAARVVGPVALHLLGHHVLGAPYRARDPRYAVAPVQAVPYRHPVVVRKRAPGPPLLLGIGHPALLPRRVFTAGRKETPLLWGACGVRIICGFSGLCGELGLCKTAREELSYENSIYRRSATG